MLVFYNTKNNQDCDKSIYVYFTYFGNAALIVFATVLGKLVKALCYFLCTGRLILC